jgi:Flp pilus assembly protein TadG
MISLHRLHCHRRWRRRLGESGSTALELTLLAPVLLAVLMLVVGLGRMAHARQQVESIAADAARAASLARDPDASRQQAELAAELSRGDTDLSCTPLEVDVSTANYRPGGTIRVVVTCVADLSDVAVSGLPGHRTFTATAVAPLEQYRSIP